MLWLVSALAAYLILAIVFLVDKYLLSKSIPDPKIYSFYVGLLGGLVLLLAFFVDFYIPDPFVLFLALFSGVIFIFGLFWFYKALRRFEASRVVPAVGGLTPLFSWGLMYLISGGREKLENLDLLALFLLILGSILITYKKTKPSIKSLLFSTISAFLLGLYFVLAKYVYLNQPFWNSFIWIRSGGIITSFIFLIFFSEVREELTKWLKPRISFSREKALQPQKAAVIFISNQTLGALANVLQNFAVFLAPVAYISLVAALQGSQYLFLLIFTLIISLKFPRVIKEETSTAVVLQKVLAIFLIGAGILILAIQ